MEKIVFIRELREKLPIPKETQLLRRAETFKRYFLQGKISKEDFVIGWTRLSEAKVYY